VRLPSPKRATSFSFRSASSFFRVDAHAGKSLDELVLGDVSENVVASARIQEFVWPESLREVGEEGPARARIQVSSGRGIRGFRARKLWFT